MTTKAMNVSYTGIKQHFANPEAYLQDIAALAKTGQFTLGDAVDNFERQFADLIRVKHAIGMSSGTAALTLCLNALDIGLRDEVITCPTTFIATVGAIVASGAKPVFVDNGPDYMIDVAQIRNAITRRTKAIMPVHYTGCMADMPAIMALAKEANLAVIEDSCQAINASCRGIKAGAWGDAAAFSLHPLKNIHVWGDGGIVTTHSDELAQTLRLLRNHGLKNRDEVSVFGVNERLDALHAVIGSRMLKDVGEITSRKQAIAKYYDDRLGLVATIPVRSPDIFQVYHLYIVLVNNRDALLHFLDRCGIEAKVHYPIALHLQQAAWGLGHKEGDFPNAERFCRMAISLPCHQYMTDEQVEYVADKVRQFYNP